MCAEFDSALSKNSAAAEGSLRGTRADDHELSRQPASDVRARSRLFLTVSRPPGATSLQRRDRFANRPLDYRVSLEQLQDWPPFIHEADRAMVIEHWKLSIESGQPFGADYRLRRSDGEYRWFHGQGVPTHAQDGSIVRWCSLVVDIEERKQAEDLRRSKERHAILDNIPGLVAIHKASGEPELFNRAAREYHGACADDPTQWKITDVIHPDDGCRLLPARRRGANAPAIRHRAAHAARGWHVSMVSGAGGPGTTTTARPLVQRSNRHPRQKNGRGCVAAERGVSARSAAAQSHWRLALPMLELSRKLAGDSARVHRSAW